MDDATCRRLREFLDQGDPGSIPAPLAAHAVSCDPCRTLIGRQTALVRMLSALPPAPPVAVAAPRLPERRGGRLVPMPAWATAAAAAVVLAAAGWRMWTDGVERVRVIGVVDVVGAPPQVDERLLALTGGVEAVAMRRPTEVR